jgi:dTDP-4-dehydrorhamnose reductase
MKILLTGGNGVLGQAIQKRIPNCIAPSKNELDITNKQNVLDFVKLHQIDTIIHAAALTSIRNCEENNELAWKTNVIGTQNLIDSISKNNTDTYFMYISTACVFKGDEEMYSEKSIPNPTNFYALTKLIGETSVQSLQNHIIIRTNFVSKKKWPYEKAFTDRYGTYLFVEDVALGIKEILQEKEKGIIHLVGDKIYSMYDLAKITTPDVKPMTLQDYSGPHITINMTLNSLNWKKYQMDKC